MERRRTVPPLWAPPAGAWQDDPPPPLVSVCLTHSSVSPVTEELVESLFLQRYPNLEFILLDDGSGDEQISKLLASESARGAVPLRAFPASSSDRDGARNAAAAYARGDYFLFVEEGAVILMPECVDRLVAAALRTGAEIVTSVPWHSRQPGRPIEGQDEQLGYFPLGGCAELGAFENCFGNGTLLVARRSFERCGGFETSGDPAADDWLFLAKSVLSGLQLKSFPNRFSGTGSRTRWSLIDRMRSPTVDVSWMPIADSRSSFCDLCSKRC